MATRDEAVASLDAYAAQRFADGAASRQAEIDEREQAHAEEIREWADDFASLQRERDTAIVQRDDARRALADHMDTHQPTPPPAPTRQLVLGMSAPRDQWATRLAEVGRDGITARRIFADLDGGARDQADLIESSLTAGMLPVISYKGTPTAAKLRDLAAYYSSLDAPLLATYWHEPWGDFTDYQVFRDRSRAFLDAVQSDLVDVGPLLNGWLLNRRVADFRSLTSPDLLRDWDFLGMDTYEEGTLQAPGAIKPASRVPLLAQFARDNGIPGKPLVIGEYNGYTGETIKAAGDAILAEPTVAVACMWNSTEGKGYVLTSDRLAAFRATKADPRVKR